MASDPQASSGTQSQRTAAVQPLGDVRPSGRDDRPSAGTSGEPGGTNGGAAAFVVIAAVIAASTTVNIFSELHETPGVRPWEPVVWEYSSGIAAIFSLAIPWRAMRIAPPTEPWPRFLAVHVPASLIFSLVHVALFVLLRQAAYAAAGERYVFDATWGEFLYEYRKDLLGYAAVTALLRLAPRLLGASAPAAEPRAAAVDAPEPLFEVRDGGRLLRIPRAEIVAVTSAGNYVEVVLADGRRPLTRMTLAQAEADLAATGFVRVHRSWVINGARVRAITPEGSGDYAVELEGGVTAPLSRRYPQALEQLRGSP